MTSQDTRSNVAPGKPSAPADANASRALARPGASWVVLGLCLLATATGWCVSLYQVHVRAHDRFDQHMTRVQQAILFRVRNYEVVLKGGAGLFAASQSVEWNEWRAYVNRLQLQNDLPGVNAMGFIARVPGAEREAFILSNRTARASMFAVSPPGDRPVYFVTQYIEPERANVSLLGQDIAVDPARREAAEYARDSGRAALTRRLRLAQVAEDVPAVVLMLPVYRNDTTPRNLEERRAALEGWVFVDLILQDLFADVIEDRDPEVDFEIFDENRVSAATLLFNTDNTRRALSHEPYGPEDDARLTVINRKWLVHFSRRPAFYAAIESAEPLLLLIGGICISFLLFGITRSLTSTRHRALTLAEQMTAKFRIHERAAIFSNNGIFITDASKPDNPIVYSNPAMEAITGYGAEELLGRGVALLMRHDTNQPDLERLHKAMEEGGECRVSLRSYRKDDSPFWNELSISAVRDSRGVVSHFVGIMEDITERKHGEEILRATSALQRAILDSAGYAVISTSPDGLINIFNAAAERMTGYKAAEVIGKPTAVLINDWHELERRAQTLSVELGRPVNPDFEVFVAKARLGQADEHEWTYLRKDGTQVPVLLSVTPVRDEHGVILGFMGIASDIAERKRAEAQLHQATQAAEAANRAKSEFLANMSHEIRTPMNAVIGMTELALGTELTREVRGYLSAARNSATDLLTIINDILDFSKIEAGKLELHEEPFALRDALGLTLKAFSLRAAEKALELTLRVERDVPDVLLGDVGRLRQIVNNLVGNALKFTEHGEVLLEVALAGSGTAHFTKSGRATHGPGESASCLLHFTVSDTGIGIPADKQERIFGAFTQADASVTRKYGGTGLGLAISSKLCHLMQGEIWVESQPGAGSQFHFTALFRLVGAGAPPSSATAPLALARAGVLLIDDNATSLRILGEMLSGWRLFTITATTAKEALDALRAADEEGPLIRFALLDAQIPGADAAALAREIRARADPPAVILLQPSASGPAETERFRDAGVDTFLVKPVGQSELLNALLHCAGSTPRSPEAPSSPLLSGVEPTRSLRVLLAEDNAVNRELATTVLHKLGHTVVTVVNGQQALAAWEREAFDLILMDVQMPAMDGIEATTLIREREQGTGKRIPIFGLTAHAMIGDREQGLAAGMDEYITKPLQLGELVAAIHRWAAPRAGSPNGEVASFHPDRLVKVLGGDMAASRRLVAIYLDTTPPLMEKLTDALARKDLMAFMHAAHTLKGSLTQLDATDAAAQAGQLEAKARAGNLEGAESQVAELSRQIDQLQHVVQAWLHAPGQGNRETLS